jgi:hypothetical protein
MMLSAHHFSIRNEHEMRGPEKRAIFSGRLPERHGFSVSIRMG